MFGQYTTIFQLVLGMYCVTSFFLLFAPLTLIAYFIFFRSTFSVAAYTQSSGLFGLPFFLPSLVLLSVQTAIVVVRSKVRFVMNGVMGTYFAYVLLCTLLCFLFIVSGKSAFMNLEEISKLCFPLLAYFIVYKGIESKDDLDKTSTILMVVAFLPIALGIVQFLAGYSYSYIDDALIAGRRPTATIVDPNLYGIFLSLILFLVIPKFLNDKNPSKLKFVYLGLLVLAIVFAQNRGTWIALFMAIFSTAFIYREHINIKKWVGVLVVASLLAAPVVLARFAELYEYDQWGQNQNTAAGRLDYSIDLFFLALQTPFTGNGAGSFDIGLRNGGGQVVPPHNDYIRIACQFGFPALLLYISFFASQVFYALKHKSSILWEYQFASFASMVYLIIISVAQNVYSDTVSYMLFMTITALSHRASILAQQEIGLEREEGLAGKLFAPNQIKAKLDNTHVLIK